MHWFSRSPRYGLRETCCFHSDAGGRGLVSRNAIWEEADYLAVCTVREVMVLPPYFHAGTADARRAAASGRNRLRVCETKGFLGDRCVDCSKTADFPGDRPGDRCKL